MDIKCYTFPYIPLHHYPWCLGLRPRPCRISCRQNIYFCLIRRLIRQKYHFSMQSQKNTIRVYYMDCVREGDETNAPWIMKFRIEFVDDDNNLLEEYLNPSAWLCYSDSVRVRTCKLSSNSHLNERKYSFPISPLNGFYQKIIES